MKKQFDKNNLEYSKREQYKLPGQNPFECLPQMFDAVMQKQLEPQFQKMLKEKDFKAVHAFAHWDSGFNKFHLDIYGEALPDMAQLIQNPDAPPQDSEHFSENMKAMNDQLLKIVFDEMMKQNITGAAAAIMAHSTIGILDQFYAFTMVWRCYPQGTNETDFIKEDLLRSNAHNN